jgi:hypothetical protein
MVGLVVGEDETRRRERKMSEMIQHASIVKWMKNWEIDAAVAFSSGRAKQDTKYVALATATESVQDAGDAGGRETGWLDGIQ